MTKEIPLTQGKVALVDDEDYEKISTYKWFTHNAKGKYYAGRKSSRITARLNGGKRNTILMHRIIMDTPEELFCDHINGDTLDNRKSNLRNCLPSENSQNRGAQNNNKLRLKNIHIENASRPYARYRVDITSHGRNVFRGRYDTLEEAIRARDEALKKHHGEFANKG